MRAPPPLTGKPFWQVGTLLLIVVIAAAITVGRRSHKGRGRWLVWRGDIQTLWSGKTPYARGQAARQARPADAPPLPAVEQPTSIEGYPNPPMMALLLSPLLLMPAIPGSVLWVILKGLLAWFMLWQALKMSKERGPPWSDLQILLLFLLSAHVIHLDLTHSNVNILIGTLIVVAMVATRAGHDMRAGITIGLAGVLKMTPFLFLPYFLWKRRWRASVGVFVGIVLFSLVVPGLAFGFERNVELHEDWADQMIGPILEGREIGLTQTGSQNQSFTGVFHRLLNDTVAYPEIPSKGRKEFRVNFVDLGTPTVQVIIKLLSLLLLAFLAWGIRRRDRGREGLRTVGEFALVYLAMLFLSERTWRPHYAAIILVHAFLYACALRLPQWRRLALGALIVGAVTHAGWWDEVGTKEFGDRVESYGIFLWGGLVLFGTALYCLRRLPERDAGAAAASTDAASAG